jgi:hypothetical protein
MIEILCACCDRAAARPRYWLIAAAEIDRTLVKARL